MSTSWEPLPSTYRSKQEFLASLPPWRRLLQKLQLASNDRRRRGAIRDRAEDAERSERTIEQVKKRLDEINGKLSAILSSSGTSSTPPSATRRRVRDVISLLEEYGGLA